MTALVIVSAWLDSVWAIGFLMAMAVLLPHLGAYRPVNDKAKRLIAAVLITGMVGTIGATVARADDEGFVILNPCAGLTPGDIGWWLRGCVFLPRRKRSRRGGRAA